MSRNQIVRDAAGIKDFLAKVSNAPFLALDTETSGLDPHQDTLLLIQFGTADEQVLVDAQAVDAQALTPIFEHDRVVVMHNASFDLKMLENHYGPLLGLAQANIADTLAGEQLLRNGRKSDVVMQGFSLKALAERYAGMELDKSVRQGFYGIESIDDLSDSELFYAERDVEATWKIFAEQLPELRKEGLLRIAGLEGQAQYAFAELELKGCPVDVDSWRALMSDAQTQRGEARRALDTHFWDVADRDLFGGTTLNYNDDEQVMDALARLGLRLPNTRKEVLLATGHPAASALVNYREHQKLVSTYGEGFLAHVHGKTGRLHPRFRASGAITGRASCSEPNLQNIPAQSQFRACFRVPPERRLITADYVGAELRIIADQSGEPFFLKAIAQGQDLHALVATRLFGRKVSKTENPELRARAKAINFGLAYGMGSGGLAEQLGCRLHEAEQLLMAYFKAFPKVKAFLETSAEEGLRRGYVSTVGGRKYWLTDMRREGRDEGSLRRVAKNMPIQGTNADMIKLAMSRIVRRFRASAIDAFLVNMVHDELVVESAAQDADKALRAVEQEMMSAGAEFVKQVPMAVEAAIGESWEH
ncbi:MAG: hypothetical protein KTR25_12420 [Myxococcales bacterium]|nr:hypothetical protein [Myxococcales bacterium]